MLTKIMHYKYLSSKKIKCSGCSKEILPNSNYTLYRDASGCAYRKDLYFCSTCMHHINRGGPIFLSTYSFDF